MFGCLIPGPGGEASSSKPNTLQACEQTAASFEAELPAMDLRQLMGQDFSDMKHIKSNTSLQEIGKEWKQHEKRDRQSRTILVGRPPPRWPHRRPRARASFCGKRLVVRALRGVGRVRACQAWGQSLVYAEGKDMKQACRNKMVCPRRIRTQLRERRERLDV